MPYHPYKWSWQDALICVTVMAIFTTFVGAFAWLLSWIDISLAWIFFIGVGLWVNALIIRVAYEPDVWDDPRMG